METHIRKYFSNREIKKKQIALLKKIDLVLELHNIKYFAFYGTLLGSIRHRGFIPWDDDIDLAIFRSEIYRLKKINWEKYDITLFTNLSSKNYPHCFFKLSDNKTVLHEDSNWDSGEVGINIDIFPLDTVNSRTIRFKILSKFIRFLKNMNTLLLIRPGPKHSFLKKLILKFTSKMPKQLSRFCSLCIDYLIEKIAHCDSADAVVSLTGPYLNESFNLEAFRSSEKIEFETLQIAIPCGFDSILKTLYGNYMVMPPHNKRATHHLAKYTLR